MANFQRDKRYDIGVEAMNRQHKDLLGLMERLQEQNETHASRPALLKTLHDLRALTVHHFREEEEYIKSFDYKDFKTHCLIHANLIAKLDEHVSEFQSSGKVELPGPLFSFLSFWLSSHIMGIDMKYGAASRDVAKLPSFHTQARRKLTPAIAAQSGRRCRREGGSWGSLARARACRVAISRGE